MKALSLRQPYAELIVQGKKTIEIRNWNTKFRGKFLVHAAWNVFFEDCKKLGIDPNKLVRGAVIGEAELVDVKKYENVKDFHRDFDKHLAENRWFRNPCYGFILKNAKRVEPFKCRGSLSFFEVEWNKK
jgi:ASC-1-like (ASCH) protein